MEQHGDAIQTQVKLIKIVNVFSKRSAIFTVIVSSVTWCSAPSV